MPWQIPKMRNYLLLVIALNIHQSSASCFGKDAHFKTTDVSSLINAKSGLSLIQFAFSATCGEPDIQDRPQPGVGVLGQDHQETRVCGQVQRLGLAGGDGDGENCALFPGNKASTEDWADVACNLKERQFVCTKPICPQGEAG